jgi:hypothetical protein
MTDIPRAIPEVSIDTQILERALLLVGVGDVVTYAQLSGVISRDVQEEARHHLASARRRVLRGHRMVFEPVMNVGLKRLDDAGKIAAGRWHIKRSRNQAKFAQVKVSAVDDFDALPNNLKVEHNMSLAQTGALLHMTSPRSVEKLKGSFETTKKELSLKACLAAMAPCL